jgi:chemotaxis protein methyltransferase CheR
MINDSSPSSQPLTGDNFRHVCELVYRESAIVLGEGKEYLVEARLMPVVSRNGFPSINALIDHVRFSAGSAALQREIVDALTTNETLFFRDFHPFEALKREVFPRMLDSYRDQRLVIWSAACSSGQEPYSIVMSLLESLPDKLDRFQIIGTDLCTVVLRRARSALYQQHEVNRGLPAPLLVKYFKQVPEGWQLRDQLRSRVDFRELNLARPWPGMPRCHLVLLRNVMIYFDVPTRKQILRRVRETLMPGGLLLLGGAETTLMVDEGFAPILVGKSTFYKVVA